MGSSHGTRHPWKILCWGTSLFPPFALIRPEHVEPGVRELLERSRARIEQLAALGKPTFATVIEPLEELQHQVSRTWSPVSHLNAVLNSDALRAGYNACLPLLSAYQTDLAQSESLYRAYRTIAEEEGAALAPVQRQVIEHALRDFRLAGVGLPVERKERFKTVMLELTQLQAKFEENVLDATNGWTYHVADSERAARPERDARSSRHGDAHTRSASRGGCSPSTSRRMSRSSRTRNPPLCGALSTKPGRHAPRIKGPNAGRWDNSEVMENILRLRHEAARLLDFRSYAEYALSTRMARTVEEVIQFLHELARAARPAALREFAELEAFAGHPLSAWDVGFYAERLQRTRYSVSQEELRPYFPLPKVLTGLFEVAERLFGVHIRERQNAPVWHSDVRFFEIESGAGQAIGSFYLDAYARPNKRSGAWMDECVGRKRLDSGSALPVAYLVCNFLPPSTNRPALLTHDDVLTLFHEFGHGLHHMLTRVDYPSIAGINGVAWDAVELPSQFLENYAWHPDVLRQISGHFQTGASAARGNAIPAHRDTQFPRGPADHAATGVRAVRFPDARGILAGARRADHGDPQRGARRSGRHARSRSGTGFPTASDTFLPAVTQPATTATSGRRSWRPTLSRPSRKRVCSTVRPRSAFSIPFSRAVAVGTHSKPSSSFAGAGRTSARC